MRVPISSKPRIPIDAAAVALVLIGSWVLVALVVGVDEVWSAAWDHEVLLHPTTPPGWPQPPGLAFGLVTLFLSVYAYPAVAVGGVLGGVYLALQERGWWRAATFAVVSLGGAGATAVLSVGGILDSAFSSGDDLTLFWWSVAALAVPLVVTVVVWLVLGRHVLAARRAR